jgi:uncharacterized protein involved in outer membrane biogenesis
MPASTLIRRLLLAILILAALAAAAIGLQHKDWDFARGWLAEKTGRALSRRISIDGPLELDWTRPDRDAVGAERWIPLPRFVARDVVIGNPEGFDDVFARVERVEFSLAILPLLGKRLVFPQVGLGGPAILLLRDKDGRNNWDFMPEPPPPGGRSWTVEVRRLGLADGYVRLEDGGAALSVQLNLTRLPASNEHPYRVGFRVAGVRAGTIVAGHGRIGGLLDLRPVGEPFPLETHIAVGKAGADFTGSSGFGRQRSLIDGQLALTGSSLADLYPLSGIALPETPPFKLAGHIKGTRSVDSAVLAYEDFSGTVGESDFAGTLTYLPGEPRPKLTGALHAGTLRLADLATMVGKAPRHDALQVGDFAGLGWASVDAGVAFTAKELVSGDRLVIRDLKGRAQLADRKLKVEALAPDFSGGQLNAALGIDGTQLPVAVALDARLDAVPLAELIPGIDVAEGSPGQLYASTRINGAGASADEMLASAHGRISAVVNRGTFDKATLDSAGLMLGKTLLLRLFGDRPAHLDCLLADLSLADGKLVTGNFLLDTQEALVTVRGGLDLRREALDFTLAPEAKALPESGAPRDRSLSTPLRLTGTLAKPRLRPAGAKAALGPAIPVEPLIVPAADQQADCAAALARLAMGANAAVPGPPAAAVKPPR